MKTSTPVFWRIAVQHLVKPYGLPSLALDMLLIMAGRLDASDVDRDRAEEAARIPGAPASAATYAWAVKDHMQIVYGLLEVMLEAVDIDLATQLPTLSGARAARLAGAA